MLPAGLICPARARPPDIDQTLPVLDAAPDGGSARRVGGGVLAEVRRARLAVVRGVCTLWFLHLLVSGKGCLPEVVESLEGCARAGVGDGAG